MNILDFGAIPDGKSLNTQAIQKAIDACHENGGGQVIIPPGIFVTGSIFLKSNVELHFMHNAVLKASENLEDYNEPDAYPQNFGSINEQWLGKHLIIAVEQTNIAITGHGTIDGRGDIFYEEPKPPFRNYGWFYGFSKSKDKERMRPGQLVCLIECSHIHITDITITNSPCWCLFLHGCDYATIRGYKAFNKPYHANTDGIDIDTCRHVTVSDCIIDTGDDAFAIRCDAKRLLKDNNCCEFINISNCTLASCTCAFRIGVGTGEIRNIAISNITISRTSRGFHLMTAYGKHGCAMIQDITINNVTGNRISYPFQFEESNNGCIRNISISNYNAHTICGVVMKAAEKGAISNINIRDLDLHFIPPYFSVREDEASERGEYIITCNSADHLRFDHVQIHIPEELSHKWKGNASIEDCDDVCVRNSDFHLT